MYFGDDVGLDDSVRHRNRSICSDIDFTKTVNEENDEDDMLYHSRHIRREVEIVSSTTADNRPFHSFFLVETLFTN